MKKALVLFIAIALGATLTACGDKEATGKADELKELDVMLDWYPNAVHSFLYVAKEKGYFEEEGLDVSIQFPANPTDPLNLAASGKIDIGFYYQPDVIMARANEDIPVKSTGVVVRSPLNHLVFKEDSPVQTPKDFEGKKVGYPGIPLNEAILKTMVKSDGGDPEAVEMVNVEFELGSSLIADKVDGVIGAYINHEVPVLESKGHGIAYNNPVDYGVPSYYELVGVTSDQTWEDEQKKIEAFWRAAEKGYDFMEKKPDEALDILLDNQDEANFPLDEEVETKSMEILLPKMESEHGFGSQSEDAWQETADWLKETGLIEEIPEMEDLFVE
ncbi:ABC transporter substrate-binding protein [Virgibacillus alimentarius]|uniref:ABC transporter substrate-binding protein n=1 Tax=Virgibacillus alimentarius TaxID=698769 RepID=UPI00049354EB|nr:MULTISPECIES: ABC transporter substrate-binding protein [Virgibacillus]HLR69239.1 ABC transporter substrate-binding protein [Virgibacillus sp.]